MQAWLKTLNIKSNSQAHLRGCNHGQMACTLSFEIAWKRGAKQLIKASKACNWSKDLKHDHMTHEANDQNRSKQS